MIMRKMIQERGTILIGTTGGYMRYVADDVLLNYLKVSDKSLAV
jgi:hypothetical protein